MPAHPIRFVTVEKLSELSGLSRRSIEARIGKGAWREGREYHRAGGRILVDLEGFEAWVLEQVNPGFEQMSEAERRAASKSAAALCESSSDTAAGGTPKLYPVPQASA